MSCAPSCYERCPVSATSSTESCENAAVPRHRLEAFSFSTNATAGAEGWCRSGTGLDCQQGAPGGSGTPYIPIKSMTSASPTTEATLEDDGVRRSTRSSLSHNKSFLESDHWFLSIGNLSTLFGNALSNDVQLSLATRNAFSQALPAFRLGGTRLA